MVVPAKVVHCHRKLSAEDPMHSLSSKMEDPCGNKLCCSRKSEGLIFTMLVNPKPYPPMLSQKPDTYRHAAQAQCDFQYQCMLA